MPFLGKLKYSLLSPSDPDASSDQDILTPTFRISFNVSLSLQIATFITSLIMVIMVFSLLPDAQPLTPLVPSGIDRINPSAGHQSEPCGTDVVTARAKGCIFDLLTFMWLPPGCYDADLSKEFLEVASEPFYYDEEAKHPIESLEVLSERPPGVDSWTTRKYHVYHCAYVWRLMHRTMERGVRLVDGMSSYHHTEHCSSVLMNTTVPMDAVVTSAEVSFPDC